MNAPSRRERVAEALLAAYSEDFGSMTGAVPRRAKDLIDRVVSWRDRHPLEERPRH